MKATKDASDPTYESLLAEKQGTEELLTITKSIAHITTGFELVRAIFDKLQKVFPFDEAGLFHLDFEKGLERDLIVDYGYDTTVANQEIKDAEMAGWLPMTDLSKKVSEEMLVLPIDEFYTKYDHPHFEFTKEIPFTHVIGGPLKQGDLVIGLLHFWSKGESFEKRLSLFKSISDQISVALSNIIANEELISAKKKTEDLLAITEAIANINTAPELVHAMFDKLQKVFPFDDAGLFELDLENKQERDLMVDYGYDSGINVALKERGIEGWMPLSSISKHVMDKGSLMTTARYVYDNFPHPHFDNAELLIFEHIICGALKKGNQTIGILYFWSKTKKFFEHKSSMFKSIQDQISVALNNIIANEKLVEEKQFKETLLEITKSISQIHDSETLFKVIYDRIQPIFQFDALMILLLEGDHFRVQYCNLQNDELRTFVSHPILVKGSPLEIVFKESEPDLRVDHVEDWLKKYPDYPGARIAYKEGIREFWLAKLYHGGQLLGCIELLHKKAPEFNNTYRSLLSNLSQQVGVTLANIRANEQLRIRERVKSLEAALLHAMNQGEDREGKMFEIAKVFQHYIPSDLIVFSPSAQIPEYSGFGFEKIGAEEYRTIGVEQFLKISGFKAEEYRDLLEENSYSKIVRSNAEAFIELIEKDRIRAAIARSFGIRNALLVPLQLIREGQNKHVFLFALYRKGTVGFTEAEEKLMHQVKPSLELGMDRQIAFHRISHLNEQLANEKKYLMEEVQTKYNYDNIIGSSPPMLQLFNQISQIAPHDSTVLIRGETGTGKELVARAIHNRSQRREKAMIKINCAALPEQLIESELFGHEKGAFTGALQQRIGKFELADKGTIFLDEIGELPMTLQSKLLRVLQEKEFERLGSNKLLRTDCRVIAATNRDLKEEIAAGNFREDLFYRLNVFPVQIPALKDRRDDIVQLATFFAQKFLKKAGKKFPGIDQEVMEELTEYSWPGNVRELENLMEQAAILHQSGPLQLTRSLVQPVAHEIREQINPESLQYKTQVTSENPETLEKQRILEALRKTKGRISGKNGAAKLLNLKPSTLEYRIRKLQILKEHKLIKAGIST